MGGFASHHPAGAIFGLGDGNVRFIGDEIDQTVFEQLGNRADGALVDDQLLRRGDGAARPSAGQLDGSKIAPGGPIGKPGLEIGHQFLFGAGARIGRSLDGVGQTLAGQQSR